MAIGDLYQDLILEEDMGKVSYTEEYKYIRPMGSKTKKYDPELIWERWLYLHLSLIHI